MRSATRRRRPRRTVTAGLCGIALALSFVLADSAASIPIRQFIVDYERPRLWYAIEVVPVNGPNCGGPAAVFMTVTRLSSGKVLRDRSRIYSGTRGCRFDEGEKDGSLFVGRLRTGERYRACVDAMQSTVNRARGTARVNYHRRCKVFRA